MFTTAILQTFTMARSGRMYLFHQACDKVLVLIESLFWKPKIFLQELAALFEAEGAAPSHPPSYR